MNHNMNREIHWCEDCGLSMEEIIERNAECEPSELGKKRFTWAFRRYKKEFNSIVDEVLSRLGTIKD